MKLKYSLYREYFRQVEFFKATPFNSLSSKWFITRKRERHSQATFFTSHHPTLLHLGQSTLLIGVGWLHAKPPKDVIAFFPAWLSQQRKRLALVCLFSKAPFPSVQTTSSLWKPHFNCPSPHVQHSLKVQLNGKSCLFFSFFNCSWHGPINQPPPCPLFVPVDDSGFKSKSKQLCGFHLFCFIIVARD